MTIRVSARSIEWTNTGRPQNTEARPHGISARQNKASKVPTALACSDARQSPWASRAKLVVIPHDGQGNRVKV
jgi:hypothetical protein